MRHFAVLTMVASILAGGLQAQSIELSGATAWNSGVYSYTAVSAGAGAPLVLPAGAWVTPTAATYYPRYMRSIAIAYPGLPGNPNISSIPVIVDLPNWSAMVAAGKARPDGLDIKIEGATSAPQLPSQYDVAGDIRRLVFVLDSFGPGGKTVTLYYGDPTHAPAPATPTTQLSAASTNNSWTFSTLPWDLANATLLVNGVQGRSVSGTGAVGWATNFAVGQDNASITVEATGGTVVARYSGYELGTPLGVSSVSYSLNYFHNVSTVAGFTGATLYPEIQLVATNLTDPSTYYNQAGLIANYNFVSALTVSVNVTNSIFGDGAGWAGLPLSSAYVSRLAWIANLHDTQHIPYAASAVSVAANAVAGIGFTLNSPLTINVAYPLNPLVAGENESFVTSGTWTSAPQDLGTRPGGAGLVAFEGIFPSGTSATFATASSPNGILWTPYSSEQSSGAMIQSPNDRYIKVRVTMKGGASTPQLQKVRIQYQQERPALNIINFPNPFEPQSGQPLRITGIPADKGAAIIITDLSGQEVRVLNQSDQFSQVGPYLTAYWDGRNSEAHYVAPGLYHYRVLDRDRQFLAKGKILVLVR